MATKLFIGSLSYGITDDQLREAFEAVGTVESAKVIIDRDTNRSKGFGFVEMSTDEEAQTAIKELNGKEIDGRPIVVNVARPREERPRNDFGGGAPRKFNNDRRGPRY